MEHEHGIAAEPGKKIGARSSKDMLPDLAHPTFRITYQRLRHFENGLVQQTHLEYIRIISLKKVLRFCCAISIEACEAPFPLFDEPALWSG